MKNIFVTIRRRRRRRIDNQAIKYESGEHPKLWHPSNSTERLIQLVSEIAGFCIEIHTSYLQTAIALARPADVGGKARDL